MKRVLKSNVNCRSILRGESRLWLEMIYCNLGGCPKIRNPYFVKCKRDIPADVFSSQLSKPAIRAVISLTSRRSIVMMFTILVGFGDAKVQKYFSRHLKGNRSGKAKVIVNKDKNFVLHYKYKQGKFVVEFDFGVWNASGYPLHT